MNRAITQYSTRAKELFSKHRVVYIDRSLIVLNKPHGLVTQGTVQNEKKVGTIQVALDELQDVLEQREPLRTLHRLDKNTTGALLIARNSQIIGEVHRQMERNLASKSYYALVHDAKLRERLRQLSPSGFFPADPANEARHGLIDAALATHESGGVCLESDLLSDMTAKEKEMYKVRQALTKWNWIASSSEARQISLLQLGLETGLKHQLRVHLASKLGCPILGDTRYAPPSLSSINSEHDRMFLHSHKISVVRYKKDGPKKQFSLSVIAPLPQPFVRLCERLDLPLNKSDKEGSVLIDNQPVNTDDLWHYTGGQWSNSHWR